MSQSTVHHMNCILIRLLLSLASWIEQGCSFVHSPRVSYCAIQLVQARHVRRLCSFLAQKKEEKAFSKSWLEASDA